MINVTVYKGINIRQYSTTGQFYVVYNKGTVLNKVQTFKSLPSAKNWIENNLSYYKGTVQVAGRCDIDLYGDTEFL